MQKYLVFFR